MTRGCCGVTGRLKFSGLIVPVGVRMGVPPAVVSEDKSVGGSILGSSKPRSFKLINLQAMLNSSKVIFPSESVSAIALEEKIR